MTRWAYWDSIHAGGARVRNHPASHHRRSKREEGIRDQEHYCSFPLLSSRPRTQHWMGTTVEVLEAPIARP